MVAGNHRARVFEQTEIFSALHAVNHHGAFFNHLFEELSAHFVGDRRFDFAGKFLSEIIHVLRAQFRRGRIVFHVFIEPPLALVLVDFSQNFFSVLGYYRKIHLSAAFYRIFMRF